MSIGSNIKAARKAKGITQKELSNKINKTFSSVQKYELDIIQPPVDVIRDIAGALEVNVSELLGVKPARAVDPNETLEEREKRYGMNLGTLSNPRRAEEQEIMNHIQKSFYDLNNAGKREAEKRIGELVQLKQYNKNETPDPPAGYAVRDDSGKE